MEFGGKRVLVVGAARSGMAAARLLQSRGAIVTVNDSQGEDHLSSQARELRELGISFAFGAHNPSLFINADLIVLSPGVPANLAELEAARRAGIKTISEVELSGLLLKGRLIGITGSNGKTTTTTLTGELMRSAGARVLVGGNIGAPLAALVDDSTDETWTVAELSSFQLETIDTLRVNVAVVTNISPDHLDRHASFDDYVAAKKKIFLNQKPDDWAVLNAKDPVVTRMFSSDARKVLFDSRGMGQADVYLKNDRIFTTLFKGGEAEVISRADIPLRGMHNVENIMASLGATICALGLDREALPTLRDAIKSFSGVEHRIEFVAEINGVRYYNDSKATNVDSTIKALEAFDRGIVLILGGKDKGSDYSVLTPLIRERVKEVILIGAASSKIESHLQSACSMSRADSMEHAVRLGKQAAQPGDTVLLAPACASFDMFENYEHRGRVFKEAVRSLVKEN